jgi:hypothetical protein
MTRCCRSGSPRTSGLEAEANEINTQTQLVPGLLQTPDYARAVIAAEHPTRRPRSIDDRSMCRQSSTARHGCGRS